MSLTDIAALSVSSFHYLALKRDGSVWLWGGDGQDRSVLARVEGWGDVAAIQAGEPNLVRLESGEYFIFARAACCPTRVEFGAR